MKFLKFESHDGIVEMVVDRPPVNALGSELLAELIEACKQLEHDDSVHGVLVRGEGRCLSAGLDLAEVASLERDQVASFLARVDGAFGCWLRFDKPLAVAVDGHAIAGGMLIALVGDFIALGRGNHKLGLTELQVGVPFPRVAFEIARLALPPRALRVLVYGAGTLPVADAFELGVGDVLCDDARAAARQWLETIVSRPLGTFRFVKREHRGEAIARVAQAPAGEREELLDKLMAAKAAIVSAYQATKR
jgi:enoyl-CoA hydratase